MDRETASTYHCEDTRPALLAVSSFLRIRPCNYPISSESAHVIPRFTYCPSGGTGKEWCNGHWRTCDWMGSCCAGPGTQSSAGLQRIYPVLQAVAAAGHDRELRDRRPGATWRRSPRLYACPRRPREAERVAHQRGVSPPNEPRWPGCRQLWRHHRVYWGGVAPSVRRLPDSGV